MLKTGEIVKLERTEKCNLECPMCIGENIEKHNTQYKCNDCGYEDYKDAFEEMKVIINLKGKLLEQHYYDYISNEFSAILENGTEYWFAPTKIKNEFIVIPNKIMKCKQI